MSKSKKTANNKPQTGRARRAPACAPFGLPSARFPSKQSFFGASATAGGLNGASKELLAMLPRYGVTGVETRRIFGRRAKLYIRLEEIVEPVQLTIKN